MFRLGVRVKKQKLVLILILVLFFSLTSTVKALVPTEEPENSVHLYYFVAVIAWLLISLVIGLKYWKWFSSFGGIVGVILTIRILNAQYFVIDQFVNEGVPSGQVVFIISPIGFLYWIPILLIVADMVMPFVKKN